MIRSVPGWRRRWSWIPLSLLVARSNDVAFGRDAATTTNTGQPLLLRSRALPHWTFPSFVTFAQPPPPPSVPPWTAWTQPDRTVGVGYQIGTVSLCSSEAFRRIGHSMFTLLVAVTRWDLRPPSIPDQRKGQIGVGIRCVFAHSHTPLHGGAACGGRPWLGGSKFAGYPSHRPRSVCQEIEEFWILVTVKQFVFPFLDDPQVPADNNGAEARDIRSLAAGPMTAVRTGPTGAPRPLLGLRA